jgi:DNA-directed RNA polymerase specialized sigma24 family protein
MSEPSCYAPTSEELLAINDRRAQKNADDAIRRVFARARSWRTPPHWSRLDWLDEVRAIVHSAAVSAGLNYDEERAVPLRAHIYLRALAAAWTRYRQEWSYYLHCVVESSGGLERTATPFNQTQQTDATDHFLWHALNQLPEEDQLLIRRLFWDNADQRRVAATLHVSQQCVSRRKARVLRQLRRALKGQHSILSHIFTVCWALLDSLDLLPVVDLL